MSRRLSIRRSYRTAWHYLEDARDILRRSRPEMRHLHAEEVSAIVYNVWEIRREIAIERRRLAREVA